MNYRDAPPSGPRPGPFDGGPLRRVLEIVVLLGVVGAIVSVVVFVVLRKPAPRPVDYGVLTPYVRALEDNVAKTPCDLGSTVKLGRAYNECRDYPSAVSRAEIYEKTCGVDVTVLRFRADAHRGLHEYTAAIAQIDRIVDVTRAARDVVYRADVHREFGKLDAALADYSTALTMDKNRLDALNAIVDLHESAKRPCDAATALRAYINANGDPGGLQARADALSRRCK